MKEALPQRYDVFNETKIAKKLSLINPNFLVTYI